MRACRVMSGCTNVASLRTNRRDRKQIMGMFVRSTRTYVDIHMSGEVGGTYL